MSVLFIQNNKVNFQSRWNADGIELIFFYTGSGTKSNTVQLTKHCLDVVLLNNFKNILGMITLYTIQSDIHSQF